MLPRAFAIDVQRADGNWQRLHQVENNHLLLVRLPVNAEVISVRFIHLESWGGEQVHLMAFEAA